MVEDLKIKKSKVVFQCSDLSLVLRTLHDLVAARRGHLSTGLYGSTPLVCTPYGLFPVCSLFISTTHLFFSKT